VESFSYHTYADTHDIYTNYIYAPVRSILKIIYMVESIENDTKTLTLQNGQDSRQTSRLSSLYKSFTFVTHAGSDFP